MLFLVSLSAVANDGFLKLEQSIKGLSATESIALLDQFDLTGSNFDAESQAKYYFVYGQQYEKTRQLELAIASYDKGIALVSSLAVTDILIDSYLERSFAKYLQTNDPAVYCEDRTLALHYARQHNNSELLAKTLTQNAFCYTEPTTVQQGIDLLSEALTVVDKSSALNLNRKALIYNATGNLYRRVGLHQQGYENFEKAYLTWQRINDKEDMFNMQHNMLSEALKLGDWDKAQKSLTVQFTLANEVKDYKDLLFFAHLNSGRVALRMNDFPLAIEHLEKAVSLHHTSKESYFKTSNYLYLALAYLRIGDAVKAAEMARAFKQDKHFSQNQQSMILQADVIIAMDEGKPIEAVNTLLDVIDLEREAHQSVISNQVIISALGHNDQLVNFENQLLANRLAINELNLAAVEDKERIYQLNLMLLFVSAVVLSTLIIFLLVSRRSLKVRAEVDFLTGLYNRGQTFTKGQSLVEKAAKKHQPLAVILFDIDNFKTINDTYGHHVGDLTLKSLSKRVKALLKNSDLIGRIGGEEFLIVLPNTNMDQAFAISERLRQGIAAQAFQFEDISLNLTVSMGVVNNLDNSKSLFELAKIADEALYRAKYAGKNKVHLAAECA
ncbi:GGDEF domain-containing protein [Shewanella sp. UCD-KL21]|uniref:tetratricopeptide repeat-containing diguanylate cyclase n=1 Tax=Shewanella sp. UCD-KL21 TaxID=1917164 RepID=UPI000970AA47|nr:GGDEF domain-containing protein [Shewanella sp. UCD-KL21]